MLSYAHMCIPITTGFLFTLYGCNVVIVADKDGKPIKGAKAYAISLSTGAGPNITNNEGIAEAPSNVQ